MTKPEVKQAQKLSEHWFGKMSSPAKKKLKEHRRKRPFGRFLI